MLSEFRISTYNSLVYITVDVTNFTDEYLSNFAKYFWGLDLRGHLVQLAYSALRHRIRYPSNVTKAFFEGYGEVEVSGSSYTVHVNDGTKDLFDVTVFIDQMSPTIDLEYYGTEAEVVLK